MTLEVKLKGRPNEDLVQGFPGVPATWPRLAGTVEIRRSDARPAHEQEPLHIAKVHVGLYRTDVAYVPTHRPSISAPKREQSFLVTRQKQVFVGPARCFALDVPFTLSLPTNRPPTATISLARSVASLYVAYVVVDTLGPGGQDAAPQTFKFPLRVRRFDTLSTFGQFREPLAGEVVSSDHLATLEYRLPVRAYGPGDVVKAILRVVPNQDWPKAQKVKLKRLSIELVQLTRFFGDRGRDGASRDLPASESDADTTADSVGSRAQTPAEGTPAGASAGAELETDETRAKIAKVVRTFTSAEQDARTGIVNDVELALRVPSALESNADGILPKEDPDVGYDARVPFTNSCSLYSIEFRLIFKARFNHVAHDVQTEDTVTLSQFDEPTRVVFMKSLLKEANAVKRMDRRAQKPLVYTEPLDREIII